jgi:hypothetical protein
MKLDAILTKAARFARRGRYEEAIKTLLPEVVRYHDSLRYHYLMGLSCLYSGDFGGAFTYLKRARDIKMRDPLVLLGLAALFLRRGETDRALDLYLEVQELDERNRIPKRALRIIRKYGASDELSAWIESGKLSRLYPPFPVPAPFWNRILIIGGCALIGLTAGAGVFVKTGIISLPVREDALRTGVSGSALEREERSSPVQIGGTYRYILTKSQVLDTYDAARAYFSERRDEASKVSLNRILESNASEAVKNKARILMSYTDVPGFDTLKDRYSYAEVKTDPVLYRDCYVIWRGMATNIQELQDGTILDFLVGYDTRSILQGIVQVNFSVPVAVNPERPLEILGRVVPVFLAGEEDIRLEGVAVHQAGFLESGRP